ncbi:MAG: rhodanese-like domain-containing protein, partial [Gammaproteobacteria bacterium]
MPRQDCCSCFPWPGRPRISCRRGTPQRVQTLPETGTAPLVVDLRKAYEFRIEHIPGAINIPLDELEQHLDDPDHDHGVPIYCINGSRTRQAEPILLDAGIGGLYHIEGTFSAWIQAAWRSRKDPGLRQVTHLRQVDTPQHTDPGQQGRCTVRRRELPGIEISTHGSARYRTLAACTASWSGMS